VKYKDLVFRKTTHYVYDSDIYSPVAYQVYYGRKFKYRFDPVPGISKYRNSPRGMYRLPKTTHERRWSYACEILKYIRGKRRPHRLVDSWSDLVVTDNRIRSWKRTKKQHQWT